MKRKTMDKISGLLNEIRNAAALHCSMLSIRDIDTRIDKINKLFRKELRRKKDKQSKIYEFDGPDLDIHHPETAAIKSARGIMDVNRNPDSDTYP